MANINKKIIDLYPLTNPAGNDLIIIEDVSAPETMKITVQNLAAGMFPSRTVSITDGTHTGTAATLEANGGNLALSLPQTITADLSGTAARAEKTIRQSLPQSVAENPHIYGTIPDGAEYESGAYYNTPYLLDLQFDNNTKTLYTGNSEFAKVENVLLKSNNLSDVNNSTLALQNIESNISEITTPSDFGYYNDTNKSDIRIITNWGGGISAKVPFKNFADEIKVINNKPNFTFIVNSGDSWTAFVSQTAGNDYSRTLITAGEYTLNVQVKLPNNILVQGETGTIINIGVPTTELLWQDGTSKTATIKNITFNNSFPTSLSTYRMFRCVTLKDCTFNFSGSIAGSTSAGQNGGYFYNCIVENCTIKQIGLFRIIDCRWGDVKGSIFRNCTFEISNGQNLTTPCGAVDNGNGLIFMDCQFFFAYTLTANKSTPVFIQGGKNASLINCYFYINNAGGYTLTFNFGNCNILNSVINYGGAITFSKASTALTSGVIGNTSFILT